MTRIIVRVMPTPRPMTTPESSENTMVSANGPEKCD